MLAKAAAERTIKVREADNGASYQGNNPGSHNPHSDPDLLHALAEAVLVHHTLRNGLPRVLRVWLLPSFCTAEGRPGYRHLPFTRQTQRLHPYVYKDTALADVLRRLRQLIMVCAMVRPR